MWDLPEMNEAVSASLSSGLTRNHSAPTPLLASLTGLCEEGAFRLSADANLRKQALMASLFLEDFAPAQWQQQETELPPLEASPQMLQPYPAAAHNHFLVQQLRASISEPPEGAPSSSLGFDPGSCTAEDWRLQQAAMAAPLSVSAPASWLPVTPPKSSLLRHNSSPATLLSHFSGDGRIAGAESRHTSGHRLGPGWGRRYDLQEPYLREESSDEMDEDGQFGRNPTEKKRCRGMISIPHEIGSSEVLVAENASISKQLSGALLPCNTTPCLARAKRGHATHPRSISERLRRSRISEGIKKLQELVPNLEKQMNTADMLDEAVEYIKCLQRQVQELSKNQVVSCDIKPLIFSAAAPQTL